MADDAELGGLAGETTAAIQRVADSRAARKAEKAADKAEKKAVKRAKKDAKKAIKKAGSHAEPGDEIVVTAEADHSRFTPRRARNALGVAKVLAPAVIPIVAPYAVRLAGAAREAWDRRQARKIGVSVDQLGEFTGRGAGLHARIAGVAESVSDLRGSKRSSAADVEFAEQSQGTLEQLAATVRAAERMPTPRRKAAHQAVTGELDRLERELLNRLGVHAD